MARVQRRRTSMKPRCLSLVRPESMIQAAQRTAEVEAEIVREAGVLTPVLGRIADTERLLSPQFPLRLRVPSLDGEEAGVACRIRVRQQRYAVERR